MFNNLRAHQGGYPNPTVAAKFAQSANDFTTLLTTTSMPSGGSITRSGQAMVYDSTGKLTYAPNNVLTYSEQFDNASWNKLNSTVTADATTAPDGTSTADKLVETTATGTHSLYRTMADTYIISVYAKAAERTIISIGNGTDAQYAVFNLSAGTVTSAGSGTISSGSITSVGSGWYRCSCKFTYSGTTKSLGIALRDASGALNYTGDGTSGLYIWGAQLEAVTYQTTPSTYQPTTTAAYYGPRFDYDPSTLAVKGLLIEGTRTNNVTYSNTFTNAVWTSENLATPVQNAVGPDGLANSAWTITNNTTNGLHRIYFDLGAGSTLATTRSIYAKAGTASFISISCSGTDGVVFNLSTGVVVNSYSSATGTITPVGNGWYRLTTTPSVANRYVVVSIGETAAQAIPATSYAGTGLTIQIYGAQIENTGTFASSYIPTVASSVARAAETFAITGYTNRLLEAYYIDEQTGGSYSGNSTVVSSGAVTISPPTFGWVTSVRTYTNANAGSIASPSWLSFSRSGNAMMTDSTGTLTWAPANQLTYSNGFDTIAAWPVQGYKAFGSGSTVNATTAPDGTTTAANLVCSTSTTQIGPYQISAVLASTYIMSIYVKANTGVRYLQLSYPATQPSTDYANFDLNTGTITAGTYAGAAMQSVGNGWYRISMTSNTAANANGGIWLTFISTATAARAATYAGNGTDAVYIWGAQLERVTYQTQPSAYIPTTTAAVYGPRYDYDASTVPATPRGLLIEESRSNICLRSQEFDNASWTKTAVTSGSAVTAPSGTVSAIPVLEDTTTAIHRTFQYFTLTAATSYTVSVYAKAVGSRRLYINCVAIMGASALYDLTTGTVVATVSGTASIVNVGNGWYRCVLSGTGTATGNNCYFQINRSTTSTASDDSYTGDGVSGLYLWGAQLEAGSFATSYIPTTTASVTRAADVAGWTSAAFSSYWNASVGSILSEAVAMQTGTAARIVAASDGTAANRIFTGTTTTASGVITASSTSSMSQSVGTVSVGTAFRIGIAYATDNMNIAFNNTLGTLDTSGAIPTVNQLRIGYNEASSANYLNGWMRSFAYYNQRLPDAILKQKSAIGAPY